ncbi:MAG: hypothetical protein ABEJ66_03030 [Candidatus Nanohaloarchaea archaeon]
MEKENLLQEAERYGLTEYDWELEQDEAYTYFKIQEPGEEIGDKFFELGRELGALSTGEFNSGERYVLSVPRS